MLREMATRYGRSPGGYVWALVEPLGMILVLSIGFSLLLRNPPLGHSFLFFYASGFLPFTVFMKTTLFVQSALRYSRPLLNYPVVSWFDVSAARALTNGVTMCTTSVVLIAGILAYLPGVQPIDPGPVAAAFFGAFVLGIGVGLLNGVLMGFFPVWATLWNILTAPLFIVSGVIWIFEDLPAVAQSVLQWNPLVHLLAQARSGFFPSYAPQFLDPAFIWALALAALASGLLLMRRFHLEILQKG